RERARVLGVRSPAGTARGEGSLLVRARRARLFRRRCLALPAPSDTRALPRRRGTGDDGLECLPPKYHRVGTAVLASELSLPSMMIREEEDARVHRRPLRDPGSARG